jgi:hypothetical protein
MRHILNGISVATNAQPLHDAPNSFSLCHSAKDRFDILRSQPFYALLDVSARVAVHDEHSWIFCWIFSRRRAAAAADFTAELRTQLVGGHELGVGELSQLLAKLARLMVIIFQSYNKENSDVFLRLLFLELFCEHFEPILHILAVEPRPQRRNYQDRHPLVLRRPPPEQIFTHSFVGAL